MTDNKTEKDMEPPKDKSTELSLDNSGEINSENGIIINLADAIDPEYIDSPFRDLYITKEFFGSLSTIYSKDNVKLITIEHNFFEKYTYDKQSGDYILGLDFLVVIPACIILSLVITAIRYKFFKKKK